MIQQLEDLLRASTVRVLGESTSGAGFFIAPDKVLTCVHVVGDSARLKVLWERDGHEPQLRDVSGRVAMLADKKRPLDKVDIDYPDIAVLEVRGLDGHPCVSIDLRRPSLGANFLTFGYPEEGGSVLLTPAELTYRGLKGVLPTVFLDLASDTIKPGMSGAPVLNLQTGEVCGVVVVSKNPAQPDGALAVPLSAMQKDLSEVLAANRTFHEQDRRWAEAAFNSEGLQPGPANRFQIEAYLRKVIDRNSQDAWPDRKRFGGPVLTPDTMERELRVIVIGPSETREVGADELTEQCQRLVFLGGPGSGKTWLAKRLARHCAQQSLEALRTGKSPEDVELPLYTTCSEFFKAGGSASEAAVSSALKFADLGSARVSTAIKALFAERDGPTLLIIDSLDEASGSDRPLRDADALPWRIVLTSRPNSWDRQLVPQGENSFKKVAVLQPLRYPEDVESIIADWFAGQPERGKDLAAQIARRPALQQAATVPLILAFFCIIGHSGEPLSAFRHILNTKVLRRMLTGSWRGNQVDSHSQPNADLCLQTLQAWAWSAAAKHPLSGIGTWMDEVSTDPLEVCWPGRAARGPSDADRNALDHIAMPLGPADFDTDKTQRRFVHRSLREHLVAQHVASLSVDEAVESLLPHLWYDPDWEYSAPVALVMHSQRDEVLRKLLSRVSRSDVTSVSPSLIDGGRELRAFMARLAAESTEDDWPPDMARLIRNAANQLAQSSSSTVDMGEAVAWGIPKQQARTTLQKLLADFSPEPDDAFGMLIGIGSRPFSKQVNQMVWLAETAAEKRETRQVLLRLLDDQDHSRAAAWLAAGLMKLEPTGEERRAARVRLLDLLARQGDGSAAAALLDCIVQLEPTDEERRAARVRLLDLLADLLPNEDDEDDPLSSTLGRSSGYNWRLILDCVIRLTITAQDKKESRERLLNMPAIQKIGMVATELMSGLERLDPTEEDCQKARTLLLESLTTRPNGLRVHELVRGLVQLAITPKGKREISQALRGLLISRYMTNTGLYETEQVISGIAELATTADEKREVRAELRELLTKQGYRHMAAKVIKGIVQLDPTEQEKRQVLEALFACLSDKNPFAFYELASLAPQLGATMEEKRRLREELLGLLNRTTDSFLAGNFIESIIELGPTSEDKHQIRQNLLNIAASQIREHRLDMINELFQKFIDLAPSAEDRNQMRGLMLSWVEKQCQARESWAVDEEAVALLIQLSSTGQEKMETREKLVEFLTIGFAPATDSLEKLKAKSMGLHLEQGVAQLDPTVDDLQTWRAWAVVPTSTLLAATRRNSTLTSWLAALPYLPPDPRLARI